VIDRVSVLQLDSVNVLCRSITFRSSRGYLQELMDRMSWGGQGELFEQPAHKASLVSLRK
jgi:uncharacterized protein YcaQ